MLPSFFHVSGKNIDFPSTHQFFGNEVSIHGHRIMADNGSQFYFQRFLQFSARDNFRHLGHVTQIPTDSFPYFGNYFPDKKLPPGTSHSIFERRIASFHLEAYEAIKSFLRDARGTEAHLALAYDVGGNMTRRGVEVLLSGGVTYRVKRELDAPKGVVKGGFFNTDRLFVQASNLVLKKADLKAFGDIQIMGMDALFERVNISSASSTTVQVDQNLHIEDTVRLAGERGVRLQVGGSLSGNFLELDSKVLAQCLASMMQLRKLSIEAPEGNIRTKTSHITLLSGKKNLSLDAEEDETLENVTVEGDLEVTAEKGEVTIGDLEGKSLTAEARTVKLRGRQNLKERLSAKGKKILQLAHVKADDISIRAFV